MPQVFQVICCYNCKMFQVHQVKKSNKWNCRGCNAKQSLKKAFKIGPARECRYLVQELNMRKAGYIQDSREISNSLEISETTFNEESDVYERTEEADYSSETTETEDHIYQVQSTEDNNRCLLDIAFEKDERNLSASSDNFEESSPLSRICNAAKQVESVTDESVNYKGSQKRPLETNAVDSFEKSITPPLKKNRGFQLILKAASKLS